MADATERSDLEILNLQKCAPPQIGSLRGADEPRHSDDTRLGAPATHYHGAEVPSLQEPCTNVGMQSARPSELDQLYRAPRGAKSESHPRIEWAVAVLSERAASRKPDTAQRYGVDAVLDRALQDPVIRSAVGIVRESACLLYHIAGFGIALMSGPETSRQQRVSKETRSAAPSSANVIPFPNSKRQATGRKLNRINHDCLE